MHFAVSCTGAGLQEEMKLQSPAAYSAVKRQLLCPARVWQERRHVLSLLHLARMPPAGNDLQHTT